jgi:hypothetical protein
MNRRRFVAVGAVAVAATATDAAADILGQRLKRAGERVTLSGWIRPATAGPGHYFIFGPHANIADPRAAELSQWPDDLTLVYPAAEGLKPGKVTLQGRLHRGRFRDEATGHAARAVLTEARLV